ncbi:unnamed protein product, partial [Gulo gulo]
NSLCGVGRTPNCSTCRSCRTHLCSWVVQNLKPGSYSTSENRVKCTLPTSVVKRRRETERKEKEEREGGSPVDSPPSGEL